MYSDILTHIFLSIYRECRTEGPVAKSAKAKQISDPPRPRRIKVAGPKSRAKRAGKHRHQHKPMSDNLSTTRPQTKGREVTKIHVLSGKRYHNECTPITVIVMYQHDSNLPTAANGPHNVGPRTSSRALRWTLIKQDFSPSVPMAAPGLRPVPPARRIRPILSNRARLFSKRCVSKEVGPPGPAPQGQGRPRQC